MLAAVLLLGAGRGVVTLMRAGLVAEFYGRAHYGAISGMLALFLTGARALAPVGAGRRLRSRRRLRAGAVGDGGGLRRSGRCDARRGAATTRSDDIMDDLIVTIRLPGIVSLVP